ncbi:MAG: hypothetical protein AMS27_08035 [Bacteroides sp. SM23_62_1]|nr:MAG: hypothetical protein AMS27_08035 [Bacteroides sp. SM23_62_1]
MNLRILRDKDENGRYELRHDSLAATIYEKITLVEKELIEVRQFIENAYENYKRRGILLAPDDLDYLKVYKGKLFIGKELEDFIQESISAVEAKVRSLKRITSFSIVALVAVVFLIGYYYYAKQDKTRAIDFSVRAMLQKEVNPQAGFQSAYQAYMVDSNNSISKKAIFDAFYSLLESGPHYNSAGNEIFPDKTLFNFESEDAEIISASFSDDDRFINGILKESSVCVWNKKGEKIISLDFNNPVLAVKLSGNNQFLGILCSDSVVYIHDLNGAKILNIKVSYHILHPDDVFQFSHDGRKIIYTSPSNEIVCAELPSGIINQAITSLKSAVCDIAISDDQNWLAAGFGDGIIRIWYSNEESYTFFRKIAAHNGPVWSVEFSENSMYILSASEDSTYCIWNLNGEKVYGSSDEGYPPQNRDPYCNAALQGKSTCIVLTAYSDMKDRNDILENNKSLPGDNYEFYTRLDFSDNSPVNNLDPSIYTGESDLWHILDNQSGEGLTCFNYSPNGLYFALTGPDEHTTGLYYADHLLLRIMQGSKPVFSNDGKCVVCIDNDLLRLYPAEASEMIRLVFDENIFGSIKPPKIK